MLAVTLWSYFFLSLFVSGAKIIRETTSHYNSLTGSLTHSQKESVVSVTS